MRGQRREPHPDHHKRHTSGTLHGNDAVGNWTAVQDTNLTAEACQWMFMTEHEIGMHGSKTVLTDDVRQVSGRYGQQSIR